MKPMNYVSPYNTTIKYGTFNGIAVFAYFIILWAVGRNPLGAWSFLGWVLPVVFTSIAIRDYRDHDLGGYVTYGRAFSAGMLLSVFAGFLFAALMYVFIIFFAHNIPQMQIDDFYANMEKVRGMISEDKYDLLMQKFEASKDNFTPGNLAISAFEERIFGGLIISLIIAAIYKRNPSPIDTNEITDSSESNPT
jgi:hypothetical protein